MKVVFSFLRIQNHPNANYSLLLDDEQKFPPTNQVINIMEYTVARIHSNHPNYNSMIMNRTRTFNPSNALITIVKGECERKPHVYTVDWNCVIALKEIRKKGKRRRRRRKF